MEADVSMTFWLVQVLEFSSCYDCCMHRFRGRRSTLGGEGVPLCIMHLCVLLVASITSNSVDCCTDLRGGEVPLCMCVLLVAIASNCFFASAAD